MPVMNLDIRGRGKQTLFYNAGILIAGVLIAGVLIAGVLIAGVLIAGVLIAGVLAVGCDPWSTGGYGEDSWAHFAGGGVFPASSGSMSPDGSTVIYASPRSGNGDIFVVGRNDAGERRLTHSGDYEAFPIYTPDGKQIVYVRETERRRHVWIMNADGSAPRQLTFGEVLDDLQDLSSDGKYLIINRSSATRGGGKEVCAYLFNMSAPEKKEVRIGRYACFGPDGKAIAYTPVDRSNEVWLREEIGSPPRFIASGTLPTFSTDGKTIAVQRLAIPGKWEVDREIRIVSVDKTKEHQIGVGHSFCFMPNSNRILYYTGYDCQVWIHSIVKGTTVAIDLPKGPKTQPVPCADGSGCLIRVRSHDKVGDIFLIDNTEAVHPLFRQENERNSQ